MGGHNLQIVRLFYPNEWRKNVKKISPSKTERFNWFLCAKKSVEPSSTKGGGYHTLQISPSVHFFNESSGEVFVVRDKPRLLILSEPVNKKKIIKAGFPLRCDSDRDVLSCECDLTTDTGHLLDAAKFAVKELGYDGVAIQHVCSKTEKEFLCGEATFVFKSDVLTEEKNYGVCKLITYAKRNNSTLRKKIKGFPTCEEIDEVLIEYEPSVACRVLYDYFK